MTLGLAERQGDLLDDVNRFCEQMLPESSVFSVLARERDRLFPDEMFADLFSDRGRGGVQHPLHPDQPRLRRRLLNVKEPHDTGHGAPLPASRKRRARSG